MYWVSSIKIFHSVLLCRREGISHNFPSGEHTSWSKYWYRNRNEVSFVNSQSPFFLLWFQTAGCTACPTKLTNRHRWLNRRYHPLLKAVPTLILSMITIYLFVFLWSPQKTNIPKCQRTNVTVGQRLNIQCPHCLSSIKEFNETLRRRSPYHMGTEQRWLWLHNPSLGNS